MVSDTKHASNYNLRLALRAWNPEFKFFGFLTINLNFSAHFWIGDKLILCGFGVGLSLSSAIVDFDNCKVLDLIEVKE